MKTLTVKNPWGHLICWGVKDVENRTWNTKYRGKILIHTSIKMDDRFREMSNLFTSEQFHSIPKEIRLIVISGSSKYMPSSCIIGHTEILDVVQDSNSIWAEPGKYHWILGKRIMYERPIRDIKGKLGLWNYQN